MKIQVLGSGCAACKNLHKAVENIVKKLNLNIEVDYDDDIMKIVEIGAMSSPVFIIDDNIITAGKVPSNEEIKQAILSKMKGESLQADKSSKGGCSCGGKC